MECKVEKVDNNNDCDNNGDNNNNISIIVITSPSISNPSTIIIESTINSIKLIKGLENKPVYIILDGYNVYSKSQTKKGRITVEMIENYDKYYQNLLDLYSKYENYHIVKLDKHNGYSYCVKAGLELCNTKYCLILQHDRKFCVQFLFLNKLLECFQKYSHIRYIGFPTIASMNHCLVLQSRYGLTSLVTHSNSRIFLNDHYMNQDIIYMNNYELQPTIFWYDSNHLCDVEKYLQIFTPFLSLPTNLRLELQKYDSNIVSKLLLKRGDFIEDRFGQAQRNLLVKLKDNPELLLQTHNWFGSYLLYSPAKRQKKEEYRQTHLKYCEINEYNIEEDDEFEVQEDNEYEEKEDNEDRDEKDEKEDIKNINDECNSYDHNFNIEDKIENNWNNNLTIQQHNQLMNINPYAFNSSKIMVVHLRGRHFDPNRKSRILSHPISSNIITINSEVNQEDYNTTSRNNFKEKDNIICNNVNIEENEIGLGLGLIEMKYLELNNNDKNNSDKNNNNILKIEVDDETEIITKN